MCPPYDKLNFLVAGSPTSTPKPYGRLDGLKEALRLKCDGMEIEWVQQVSVKDDIAAAMRALRESTGCALTAHGPYYINLNSPETRIVEASIRRILLTARKGALCGCTSFTFHAAFMMGMDSRDVHRGVVSHLQDLQKIIRSENLSIKMRPELTGKPSSWGSLDELFEMAEEIPGVEPCIDWAHLHARNGGGFNSRAEFRAVLKDYESVLGQEGLRDMHMHVGGIEYSPKGERYHLPLKEGDLKYKELLRTFREFDVRGVIVAETPLLEADTLLVKRAYRQTKH
jgi:deoxyribonuclease-4